MHERCYTIGATLHVHAVDLNEAAKRFRILWNLYPDVIVADWEIVEEYDPETGEVVTEWEEEITS